MQPGQKTDGSALTLNGERTHGQDVRMSNVTAVVAVANILKSSLGPQGLDKMLVDDIGDVLVTNDGAKVLFTKNLNLSKKQPFIQIIVMYLQHILILD
jgi:chaperonin GroEL (HSP60 family)